MNIIGTFPKAKGWVVHYHALTGAVYGDYQEPIGLSAKQTAERAAQAVALLAATPVCPPKPTDPSRHATNEEWAEWRAKINAVSEWENAQEEQHWRAYENFLPVFREVATFYGYTRGRSSVTMQFKFSNGAILEIGPSGIDKFILGVQNGSIVRKDGGFDLTFQMEKKGANVYMMPLITEHDFKGMTPYEAPGA